MPVIIHKTNKGDTIVEVMIAIVILGAALGSAFALSSRSVRQTQANHERYQIQLWVNQQAELIRADYAEYIKTGKDRSTYSLGDGGISGICKPSCSKTEYGGVTITVTDNPTNEVIVAGLDPLKYIIAADWYSLSSGNQSRLELRYDI